MRSLATILTVAMIVLFAPRLFAQTFPVPTVNNPLVPAAAVPGGAGFTLIVNGTEFVAGDTVGWNGTALATTFVSPVRLTAKVSAAQIRNVGTIFVIVATPTGGQSNAVFFQVTAPTTSLAFTRIDTDFSPQVFPDIPDIYQPSSVAVADLTNTGVAYLAVANSLCPFELECGLQDTASVTLALLGSTVNATLGQKLTGDRPAYVGAASVGGQMGLFTEGSKSISYIGGLFATTHIDSPLPSGIAGAFASGDFNEDGQVDLVIPGQNGIAIFLGNGDGSVGAPAIYDGGTITSAVAVGDFNADGHLDIAVAEEISNFVSILLGNGDGTFQSPVPYSAGSFPGQITVADFNHDGKLDLALISNLGTAVSVLLGNGDGTFQTKSDYPAGLSVFAMAAGDFDGNGVPDLAVIDSRCVSSPCPAAGSVNVLLGTGDGTLQGHLDFASGGQPTSIVAAEFAQAGQPGVTVGRPGFAVANQSSSTVSVYLAVPTGLVNAIPTISSISPLAAPAGSGDFTLSVSGTTFASGSTVVFGGQQRATTFVSTTQLTAQILASDLINLNLVNVFVSNPPPGGGPSSSVAFNVFGPAPIISSLSPSVVVAGGPAFTLTLNGSNFVRGSTANFDIAQRASTFLSSSQLAISVAPADIATARTVNISITDPVGNGGNGETSSAALLTILPTNVQPVVGALVPASVTAGGPSLSITIGGTGFTASSVVTFNSHAISSGFFSATQLQAVIPASAIVASGNYLITVGNPDGNPSVAVTFVVNNPLPSTLNVSPASIAAGSAATTLNVSGGNFTANSVVNVNGSPRVTTYVSATSLNAVLTALDFAGSGTLAITVSNPAPGGGVTTALTVVVTDFSLNVTATSPPISAGQPASFTLMIMPSSKNSIGLSVTSPLPAGTTATLSAISIPAGKTPLPVTLMVATTQRSVATPLRPLGAPGSNPRPWILATALLLISLLYRVLALARPRLAAQFLLPLLLMVAAALWSCGGYTAGLPAPGGPGTPAGNYQITVSATANSGTLTATLPLTVN
jgi:hypothetical protein